MRCAYSFGKYTKPLIVFALVLCIEMQSIFVYFCAKLDDIQYSHIRFEALAIGKLSCSCGGLPITIIVKITRKMPLKNHMRTIKSRKKGTLKPVFLCKIVKSNEKMRFKTISNSWFYRFLFKIRHFFRLCEIFVCTAFITTCLLFTHSHNNAKGSTNQQKLFHFNFFLLVLFRVFSTATEYWTLL